MDFTITPSVGEVYAVRLPNNYYGAIRVLKRDDDMVLLATSPFLEKTKPLISNVTTLEILRQYRYYFDGEYALMWYEGKLPTSLEYIGMAPLDKKEKKINCMSFTDTHEEVGFEAYFEWVYKSGTNLNEVYVPEESDEKFVESISFMEEEDFWSLINYINSNGMEKTSEYLSNWSIEEIKKFEATLTYKLYLLDTRFHAKNMLENEDDYFSPDIFLYSRCGVLMQGKEVYETILENPSLFTSENICEELLSIASQAYYLKVGEKMIIDLEYDYETGSNEDGWS